MCVSVSVCPCTFVVVVSLPRSVWDKQVPGASKALLLSPNQLDRLPADKRGPFVVGSVLFVRRGVEGERRLGLSSLLQTLTRHGHLKSAHPVANFLLIVIVVVVVSSVRPCSDTLPWICLLPSRRFSCACPHVLCSRGVHVRKLGFRGGTIPSFLPFVTRTTFPRSRSPSPYEQLFRSIWNCLSTLGARRQGLAGDCVCVREGKTSLVTYFRRPR